MNVLIVFRCFQIRQFLRTGLLSKPIHRALKIILLEHHNNDNAGARLSPLQLLS